MRNACLLLLLLAAPLPAWEAQPLSFEVTLEKGVADQPCSGRLFVMLSGGAGREPRLGPSWFKPDPFFAVDVKDWKPGTTRTLGPDALAYPVPVVKVKKGTWSVQAVLDLDRGGRHFGNSPGNLFSKARSMELDGASGGKVSLSLDQVVKEREFKETDRVKLVDVESKLLSAFHKRPIRLRAGVVLPKSFRSSPEKKYPVIYEVPGFSGTHFMAFARATGNATDVNGVEFLHVTLDPECRAGHHVFADSVNNGPCGEALVKELIPHLEKTYRALAQPGARFVTGHSSGGWSSLWLQVTYPDFFGGVWSTSPDPVDFRDFQRINLYRAGENMFADATGKDRPIARQGDKAVLFYKGFSDMEEVMGRGGQLSSFEAVFSPRGTDGQPRKLWDRKTGAVDGEVARAWEKYDIRLVLERNWPALKPKLAGKVHVYMGGADTFYLEGATALLKESLAKLGSDAKVEIFPGKDHGSVMDRALKQRIAREMAEQFRRSQVRLDR
jgi:enterochelin esterase-like enzyme